MPARRAPPARPPSASRRTVGKATAGKAAADKRPLGIERRVPAMPEDRQSQLKLLIARGKEQGYLTYAQVNDHLPSEIVDPEQIEDIVNTINDMGIPVYEKAPDTESLLADRAFASLPTRRRSRKPPPRSPRSMPNSAAPPTRCACTCARWARWNC